jgi:hypothetical protein
VPMAIAKLVGKTKIVSTRSLRSPQGTPPFDRIAEICFPRLEALERCLASRGAQETLAMR